MATPDISQKQKEELKELESLAKEGRLTKKQKRLFKRLRKKQEQAKKRKRTKFKQVGKWAFLTLALAAAIYGGYYYYANREILPPTDMANHIEKSPSSHILKEPMPIAVHKHMLEHADGKGKPGVIINYNCKDFDCKDDFLPKLEELVQKDEYKDFLYLAPYPNMSTKLVLTKLGKQETLDQFNAEKIKQFIEN